MSSVANLTGKMKAHTELLSIEQAAERLGLAPVTIRQWAAGRRIARIKLGRRVLIPATEVERLIKQSLIPALSEGVR